METKKKENVVAGVVGAFLGSLLGVGCIVILGQLGYVAAISGVIMAVCALKGYELLGSSLSKKGVVISGILVIVMTYVANRLDWAISVSQAFEVDVFRSFQAIDALMEAEIIESGRYWGSLAMLYLFTLLGAVPTITNGLRNHDMPTPPPVQEAYTSEEGQPVRQLEIYKAEKGWMTPLRAAMCIGMILPLAIGVVLLVVFTSTEKVSVAFASMGAIMTSLLFVIVVGYTTINDIRTDYYSFVRGTDGTLWRIQQGGLNMLMEYRFSKKSNAFRTLTWERLDEGERLMAEASIRRAIEAVSAGQASIVLRQIVLPLTDLELVKENRWRWIVSYQAGFRRKRLRIGKGYPNLRLTPEAGLAEGKVPFRWGMIIGALIFALICGSIGYVIGWQTFEADHRPASAVAQAPKNSSTYSGNGITYQIDSAFEDLGGGVFYDSKRGAQYQISVKTGDTEAAEDALVAPIGAWRMDSAFDSFLFDQVGGSETLVPMETQSGETLQYNILSLYLKDGRTYHIAVALSEDGRLIIVEAAHGKQKDEKAVKGAMMFILESIEFESSAL